MIQNRREFLGSMAFASAAGFLPEADLKANEQSTRRKMAVITTEWSYYSHAWHMAERFLVGYPINGKWHRPPFDVVSAYVDQFPEKDLARKREAEFGFKIYPSVAEALRLGGDKLAVDAVLIIGEHGKYPKSEFEQTKYPRYEFFKQVTDVYRKDGRTAPVFNDKHLSWKWDWAVEMVKISKELNFGFCAGSSLPVTWRMPAIEMPMGAEVDELMCVAIGGIDSYDFHALEVIQCMAERRKGGETGVASMQAMRGDAVWQAMEKGSWDAGGFSPQLFESCLCRSHTLAQPETFSDRFPTTAQMRQSVAYRFQYNDGTRATMLIMNGLVGDFTFAAKLKNQAEPISTLFHLPPNPNVVYSASLMSKAEETFLTGKAPYPIERTLLTTGLVEAGVRSLGSGQKKMETPHLAISYQPTRESTFARS
jgi:hypothetical protein